MPLSPSPNTVGFRYTDTGGASIGTSFATFTYATKNFDSNNIYSGGTATTVVAGTYQVSASITTAAVTEIVTNLIEIQVLKNGAVYSRTTFPATGGTNNTYSVNLTDVIQLVATDTVVVQVRAGTATTANTSAGYNTFSLIRVGA